MPPERTLRAAAQGAGAQELSVDVHGGNGMEIQRPQPECA
jgi:hypothetical protein